MRFLILLFSCFAFLEAKGIQQASLYFENSSPQLQIAMRVLEKVDLSFPQKILDIGCGEGKITSWIAHQNQDSWVTGIDVSSSMIDFAQKEFQQNHLLFKKKAAEEIDEQEEFDTIFSFSTLHWILDPLHVFSSIQKALKPQGKAYLHTYGEGGMNVTTIADELIRQERWRPYFPNYKKERLFLTEEEFDQILERAGFFDRRIEKFWNENLLNGRVDLVQFAKPVLNFIEHLPDSLQTMFVEEVVDEILRRAEIFPDGKICYKTLNFVAFLSK